MSDEQQSQGSPVLEITDLNVSYGRAHIIRGLGLELRAGEIKAIIGPNGSGKSTLVNTIGGMLKPGSGRIEIAGRDVAGLSPRDVLRAGCALVPQGRSLFQSMTVRENVLLGAYMMRDQAAVQANFAEVIEAIPIVGKRLEDRAGGLSGGQQQMVAVARGLMSGARQLLVLDEPSVGVAPKQIDEMIATIHRLRSSYGLSLLVVEQNIDVAARVSDRTVVLVRGAVVHETRSAPLVADRSQLVPYFLG